MKLGTPRFTGQHYLASVATVKVILYRSCCEPCLLGTGKRGCDDDFSVNWAAQNGPNGRLFLPYNLKDE